MSVLDLRRAPLEVRLRQPRERAQAIAVAAALAMLPLLIPSGPGNTGLVDVGVTVAAVVVLAALYRTGEVARLPFVLGWGLIMVAGAVAALAAGQEGSALAIVQDALVLAWGLTIANACRSARVLRTATRAWCVSATVWATVMVTAYFAGFTAIAGVSAKDGGRASLTFGDPNLAGNYLVTSLFVVLACRYPARAVLRWPAVAALLVAIALTGSNGAVLSMVLGLFVALILGVRRRHGLVAGVLVACLMGMLVLLVQPHVDIRAIQSEAAASVPLVKDSVGRSGESKSERTKLMDEGKHLYWQGNLIGIGPGRTKKVLAAQEAPYVKEAHDDYLAMVIERGVLGGLGLILLVAAVATRVGRVVGRPLRADFAAVMPRPEMLAGACTAMLLSAVFYEVLHFRHLWALLGVIAAVDLWGKR